MEVIILYNLKTNYNNDFQNKCINILTYFCNYINTNNIMSTYDRMYYNVYIIL